MSKKQTDIDVRLARTVRETRTQLLAALARMLPMPEAEEVVQEAYLRLFMALQKSPEIEIRPYIFRVARNLAISRLRHQRVVHEHASAVEMAAENLQQRPNTEHEVCSEQDKQSLLAAINSLPPACRQVFVFRKIEGMSHREISERMGISVKTVENHIARGMRLCREYFIRPAAVVDHCPAGEADHVAG
ncbi:RNA polymerase sigma factor [Biformimicrobium ophioploci]|uniref:Sigma-70 family RNA polymerase sigma factor n=1 Tax=Biformimicrobium ophioploci TaxID=3036711 RepID=A0ABQ6LXC8_9GAMM|nr:sigma-70 family RNA polymerase sigma factor [Microbulbifer sp. NKW57]GMG86763.1 sigma-70 family RNA polymerase sigma factor [Microbulbifer sp. NKW57]